MGYVSFREGKYIENRGAQHGKTAVPAVNVSEIRVEPPPERPKTRPEITKHFVRYLKWRVS